MTKKQSGLGRNFYSLLDDNMIENKEKNTEIRLADIEPRKDQPRKEFDRESLEALADSISEHGVLQPIIVRENEITPGTYEIIAGERRWRAAKMAGLTTIPTVVLTGDDLKVAQVSLIENVQRQDLNPVEEAFAYSALIERFSLTQEQVAKQAGKSRSAVANMLRLLDLPDGVLQLLKDSKISSGHARALLGLNNPEMIQTLADRIILKDLSVRETENAVKIMNEKASAEDESSAKTPTQKDIYMKDIEVKAMNTLGRRVKINSTARKQTVELTYEDTEDLEELLRKLCGSDFFDEMTNKQ